MLLSNNFAIISNSLEKSSNNEHVVVRANKNFTCQGRRSFWDYLPRALSLFFPEGFKEENRRTIQYFYKVFGQRRVAAISERYGLSLDNKYARGISLTKREIKKLFVGVADVRGEDLEQLFREIKLAPFRLRHLNPHQTADLFRRFEGKSKLRELDKADYDALYAVLIPFSKIEHIFLNKVPRILPHSDRSDSYRGRKNRVFLLEEMRRNPHLDELFWEVRMAKRIIHDALPKGVLIPHPLGYFEKHALIKKGGSYKLLFNVPGNFSLSPLAAYLSTRTSFSTFQAIESKMEDFRCNIGAKGVKSTFNETQRYFRDPHLGFIKKRNEKISLLGMSLGGAHAQRDACLFLDRVEKLTTVCSAGIDKRTYQWFAKATQFLSSSLHVKHIIEEDDMIPHVGDGHLGIGCDSSKVYVEHNTLAPENPQGGQAAFSRRISVPRKQADAMRVFLKAFIGAHRRETTSLPHRIWKIDNHTSPDRINRILNNASDPKRNSWEKWRIRVSTGLPDEFYRFLREKRPISSVSTN